MLLRGALQLRAFVASLARQIELRIFELVLIQRELRFGDFELSRRRIVRTPPSSPSLAIRSWSAAMRARVCVTRALACWSGPDVGGLRAAASRTAVAKAWSSSWSASRAAWR